MPLALYALTAGAFGIGVTEFVIMGLLMEVGADFGVSISMAGLLISGYALGVVVGAPILTAATSRLSRKTTLLALMAVFTIGNAACALAPDYATLMAARILTAFAHGTFFGVGSVVATSLVAPDRRASAIAIMFTGLTVANVLGVPFGTWLGQAFGWRSTFWAVALVGLAAFAILAALVPPDKPSTTVPDFRSDLKALMRRPVLLGLLTTVLGYAGVFAVFTYIVPLLTRDHRVFGGRCLADPARLRRWHDPWQSARRQARGSSRLVPTMLGSLLLLTVVLGPDGIRAAEPHSRGHRDRASRRIGLCHRRAAADVGA
jgi:DHA1 family inner membrane transport protein